MPAWTGVRWRAWIAVAVWAGLISVFSSGLFSGSHTGGVLLPVLRALFPGASSEVLALLHASIRKMAHFVEYRATRAWLGGPLMFGAGVVAGLLGIGAGALKVLIHDLVMGMPPKVSTTTSNLIIGVTALAGTSVYLSAGLIDPGLAAPVILGVTVGAFLGTRILVRLSNEAVRRVFLCVLGVLGVEMIVRGLRGGS